MVQAQETGKLSCRIEGVNLADLDFFSKSDPVCLCEEKVNGVWQIRSQTERIMDELNPTFTEPCVFSYASLT